MVLDDGSAACWGSNVANLIEHGTTSDRLTPVAVAGTTDGRSITAGANHICVLLSGGTATCWGHNVSGQLGAGHAMSVAIPQEVYRER